MKTPFRILTVAALLAGLMAAIASPTARAKKPPKDNPPAPYFVVDLGGFTGGEFVQSDALRLGNPDELGVISIVGDSRSANGDFHAAVWTAHPDFGPLSLEDLTPTSFQGEAVDTNDAGWVVGWSSEIGFLSIPGQPLVELPSLSTATGRVSVPTAINNVGQIVGHALVDVEVVVDGQTVIETETHGMLWQMDQTGAVVKQVDLGVFFPNDINEFGVMAGQVEDPSSVAAVAEVDSHDEVTVTLLTAAPSRATALNDLGQAVGWMLPIPGNLRREAFLWDADNGLQLLGYLPGRDESEAYGINNHSEIVGSSRGGKGRYANGANPFLWRDGEMVDLNELHDTQDQFRIGVAADINDAGQIAVTLRVFLKGNDGEGHAGLLLPTQP